LAQGIRPVSSNPGGSAQPMNVIQMEGFSAEVDWRNLCPESRAESGDAVSFLEYLYLEHNDDGSLGDLLTDFNNQFTWVGYDIQPAGNGGCYIVYDSFGNPNCTITKVIDDC
jgi:MSHA pilin protein MshA